MADKKPKINPLATLQIPKDYFAKLIIQTPQETWMEQTCDNPQELLWWLFVVGIQLVLSPQEETNVKENAE